MSINYDYVATTVCGLNAVSTILAMVVVYLYFWLPNVRDIYGTCIFHYSLNAAILHALGLYYWITDSRILPGILCFIELDVAVFFLTTINIWSIILSYNTWKENPQTGLVTGNPRRRLIYYRFIGYGIPLIYLLVITNLHLSLPENRNRSDEYDVYDPYVAYVACFTSFLWSLVIPVASSTIMNGFYFIDTQRRLLNLLASIAASENVNPGDNIVLQRLTHTFRLNLKLCTTMHFPFAISLFFALAGLHPPLHMIPFFFASLHGTMIFLVAVAFRNKSEIRDLVRHDDSFRLDCIRPANHEALETVDGGDGTDHDEASDAEGGRAAAAPRNIPRETAV